MEKITKLITVAIFLTLIIGVGGAARDTIFITGNGDPSTLCSIPSIAYFFPSCRTTPAPTDVPPTTARTTTDMDVETTTSYFDLSALSTTESNSGSSLSPTSLERAHWCRFSNGSYTPLYSIFLHQSCSVCQCLASHQFLCTKLQCMPTYCIDNSKPVVRPGQCCPQCVYEVQPTSCTYKGVPFPHGTVLKRTSDNLQCWCQYGIVECRKSMSSVFSGLDFLSGGTTTYIIIVVIIIIVLLGTLLCALCTLFYYYYYKRNQDAYAQYWNNGGWQPMGAEEQVADAAAQEKQMEAEQSQYQTELPQEYVPPPYAFYNGSYPSEETVQHTK